MNVKDFYVSLNEKSQIVFTSSVKERKLIGKVYDLAAILDDWNKVIPTKESNELYLHALEQLQFSVMILLSGYYRASFAALRLSLEMLFGGVYFSTRLLEYREWIIGREDIKWNTLVCFDNGILSKRFAVAFYPDLEKSINSFNNKARMLYRSLSEYVHGNYNTWNNKKGTIKCLPELIIKYDEALDELIPLCNYILFLRYIKEVEDSKLSLLETHIMDSLEHIEPIRIHFGGQK